MGNGWDLGGLTNASFNLLIYSRPVRFVYTGEFCCKNACKKYPWQWLYLGNSDICAERKISFINETKRNKIWL